MKCNSCLFPISEKDKKVECGSCGKHTHSFCLLPKGDLMVCDVCLNKPVEKTILQLPEKIRRTYIELYRACPNKFKLEVIEGNKQPPRPYTQVGIDLHEIFEKASWDRSYVKSDWYNDYFNGYVPKQREMGIYKDEEEEKAFEKRAISSFDNFELVLPTIPKPFKTEETIEFDVGEGLPKASFTMDLITENENGNLDLHDWKTGKELVGKQLASDLQAPIYIYGVEKEYGRQVDSFTFHYLKDGKTRKFVRVSHGVYVCTVGKRDYFIKTAEMIGDLQKMFGAMKKGDFNIPKDTKRMYFPCKMCHLKEEGLCLGADQEVWKRFNQ